MRTLAGQTVTLSFFAKSNSARTQNVNLIQIFGAGSPTSLRTAAQSFDLTTSWQRFTRTFVLPDLTGRTISVNSWLGLEFNHDLVDGSVLDLWGVQLEAGPVATPFRRNANSLQGELAACQRYYYRIGGTANQFVAPTFMWSTTSSRMVLVYPTELRATPTISLPGTVGDYRTQVNGANLSPTAVAVSQITNQSALLNFTVPATTAGFAGAIINVAATAIIEISAEL